MAEPLSIGIVGAGFTGSLLATHLVRAARGPLTIVLIERRGRFGPGLAYSTTDTGHLLNVRAGNMSAFPDDPDHFLRWLKARGAVEGAADGPAATGLTFASRRDYGIYVSEVLADAVAHAPANVAVEHVCGEVVGLTVIPDGVRLLLDGLRHIDVRQAALCTGHLPPVPPAGIGVEVASSPHFIADPWEEGALEHIDRDARVMVVGSGLTMVDVVLSLQNRGHRGHILALSRRGFLPHTHAAITPFDGSFGREVLPDSTVGILRRLRRDAAAAEAAGAGWRSAFDAVRPYHNALWQGLPLAERRRFLRHLRPYWDIHRHRMAPEVARRVAALQADERLTVRAGRIQRVERIAYGLTVTVGPRGGGPVWQADTSVLINCSGPSSDYNRARDPVVQAVLEQGLARPDPLHLGLDVTDDGALIDNQGRPSRRLFAFGPLAKAPFYEMTAVPELRNRCAEAARLLTA